MHEQIGSDIATVWLEDGFVIYDRCNERAWVQIRPESALMEVEP